MQTKKNALKAAIITMSFVQMATNGIAPILEEIGKAFPDASAASIQFLMTFPSIFVVVFALLAAIMTNRLPQKTLAMTGLGLTALAGLGACLMHGSLTMLFAWAAVLGIGVGMVSPIAPGLVAERFTGNEQQTMLGIQNSSANIGSMLMTFLGGFLAAAGWQYGYLVYLIAIPGLICTMKGVAPAQEQTAASATKADASSRPAFKVTILKEMIIAFCFLMLFSSVPANLAMLISEKGIGGPALAGTMSTLFLLGGTIGGFLYGKVASRIGNFAIPFGAILLAVGAILISGSSGIIMLSIACMIGGASISMIMPACMAGAASMTGYETIGSAMIMSSSNVGVFLMPMLTTVTAAITGSSATSYRFIAVAVLAALLAAITAILNKK